MSQSTLTVVLMVASLGTAEAWAEVLDVLYKGGAVRADGPAKESSCTVTLRITAVRFERSGSTLARVYFRQFASAREVGVTKKLS